jgi:hypothetical protein
MENPSRILGLALAILLSCAAVMAADTPAQKSVEKPLKEGWDRKQIKVFAYACTDGLLEPTVRDYNAAAQADGVKMHKPFPEQAFRDSAFPMCLCISERVAQTWTLAQMDKVGMQRARPYIDEALAGGQCKPAGMLGDILKKQKDKPN